MKKMHYLLIMMISFLSCNTEVPTQFSKEALNDTFINSDGNAVSFESILNTYEGKTVLIDVWASWCRDCIVGMPKVKQLQSQHEDVVFVFLSLDKSQRAWKNGILKYKVEGEHYFMQSGWDGPFGEFLNLNWIPRYLVINKAGNIELFKATKAKDKKLAEALKK